MKRHTHHFAAFAISTTLFVIGMLGSSSLQAQERRVRYTYDHCVGVVRSARAEPVDESTRRNIQNSVALSSGVTTGGVNGWSVRYGRATETSIRVDTLERIDAMEHYLGDIAESRHMTIPSDPVIEPEEAEPADNVVIAEPVTPSQPPVVEEARIE